MVTLTISAAGRAQLTRGLPATLEFDKSLEEVTVGEVKSALAVKFPEVRSCMKAWPLMSLADERRQFSPSRQKLSLKGEKKALIDENSLQEAGIHDGDELAVKDLGPQLGWRTVYLIEYVRSAVAILILLTYTTGRLALFLSIPSSTTIQPYMVAPLSPIVGFKSAPLPPAARLPCAY